jgi:hypothetical protein
MIAASLSRSVLNKSYDEIEIPPAPPGKCSAKLQVILVYLLKYLYRHIRKISESIVVYNLTHIPENPFTDRLLQIIQGFL